MSSHVSGERWGGRGKNKPLPPHWEGTWDELPCPPNGGGARSMPLLPNRREGTCTSHYSEWVHTAPPIYNRGDMSELPCE